MSDSPTAHRLRVGTETVVESRPSKPPFWLVFEDDGATGYVYALDARRAEDPILDALHIYNAAGVTDGGAPSALKFVWSEDERAVAVIINDHAHAFVDFGQSLAMCANDFPPVAPQAFAKTHAWDEEAFTKRFPTIFSEWSWRQQQRS